MTLNNFDTRIMKVDMECQGVYSAHVCHLCRFVGHYLSLKAYDTPLI